MRGKNTSKHLLFGVLALHNGLIKREDFLSAVGTWLEDKQKPIDQILLERKALSAKDHEWLKPAVERHIQDHQGNATLSLAAVDAFDSVREQLENLEDTDVEEALSEVAATIASKEFDEYPTIGATRSTPGESQLGSRFRILRAHRGGGLGFVSVAEDEELHREVALKQIRQKYADEDKYRNQFRVEAEITGGLEHPSIIPVYGLGQDVAGRPFYAMRFIRGDSLKDAIKEFYDSEELEQDAGKRRLRFRELLRRFVDMCDAIHYAHSRGVLHRDLKPGNVMLGRYGETLVVDWGLAIPHGRDESTHEESEEPTLIPVSASTTTAEQKGVPIGTPQYMAPEQATGRIDQMGPHTDVYALGATLYCILTGRAPFIDKDISTTLLKVERGRFPKPRTISSDIPKPLEAICVKAMATRVNDRYTTARELADDIERWLADEPVSSWKEPVYIRVRRWIRNHQKLVAGVAAAAMVTLVSAVVLSLVVNNWRLLLENSQRQFVDDQIDQLLDENAADDIEKFDTILTTLETEPFAKYAVKRLADEWQGRPNTAPDGGPKNLGLSAAIVGLDSTGQSFEVGLADNARSQLWESLLTAESPHDFDLADRYLVQDEQESWNVAAGNDDGRGFRALMSLAIHDGNDANWNDANFRRLATLLIDQDPADLSAWAQRIPPDVALGIKPYLEENHKNASGQNKRRAAIALVALPTSATKLIHEIPNADVYKLTETLLKLEGTPEGAMAELENLAAFDDLDAKGRANLSIALLYLKGPEEIKHLPIFEKYDSDDDLDETARQQSIEARLLFERYARVSGISLAVLHDWLRRISNTRPEQKQTAIHAIGGHDDHASTASHQQIVSDIELIYQTDPDSGVHASAEWLLRKWQLVPPTIETNPEQLDKGFRWYINELGQTFVRVDGDNNGRDFWVSATEITIGDYAEYVVQRQLEEDEKQDLDAPEQNASDSDREKNAARAGRENPIEIFYNVLQPEYYHEQKKLNRPWTESVREVDKRLPINCLSSLHAMAYCTWASTQDSAFTDGELCYVIKGENSQTLLACMEAELLVGFIKTVTDCDRMKHGYRLPSYDEWNRILAAGNLRSITHEPLADDIGWHSRNSSRQPHAVGQKRPNRLGVFDLLGNVAEFVQANALKNGVLLDSVFGSSFNTAPREEVELEPEEFELGHESLGFRIVRTAK